MQRPAFADNADVHSKTRDAHAIRYHYDVGNDFYSLWLDEKMVYSCAYFAAEDDSLEQAQINKLDRICRKLRLKPGEKLLDIGCGWGGLAIYAAKHYGVQVTGITLSPAQAEVARARAEQAGVGEQVTIEIRDYRDLSGKVQYDKVASVGMVEHVGRARFPQYFAQIYRLLRPGGLFLNHGIVKEIAPAFIHWGFGLVESYLNRYSFLQNYVFPDGDLRRISEMNLRAELSGFELRDAENIREHYALTLRQWVKRLEAHHEEAVALTDEVVYRIWRLYMSGSAQSFAAARIGVVQTLFVKPHPGGRSRAAAGPGRHRGRRALKKFRVMVRFTPASSSNWPDLRPPPALSRRAPAAASARRESRPAWPAPRLRRAAGTAAPSPHRLCCSCPVPRPRRTSAESGPVRLC